MSSCWTCIAWRKKCSDTSTPCGNCALYNLPCYGYGNPPDWLDGGPKEKAQGRYFKDLVKQTLSSRGKRRIQPRRGSRRTASFQVEEGLKWDNPTTTELSNDTNFGANLLPNIDTSLETCQHRPSLFDLSSQKCSCDSIANRSDLHELVESYSYDPNFTHSSSESTSDCSSLLFDQSWLTPATTVSSELVNPSFVSPSMCMTNFTKSVQQHASQAPVYRRNSDLLPDDARALRYFLESLLPRMFPFLEEDNFHQLTSIISTTAIRSRTCLASIVSQSVYHQQLQLDSFGLSTVDYGQKATETEDNAFGEIQQMVKKFSNTTLQPLEPELGQEILITLTNLVFSTILRGTSSWQPIYELAMQLSTLPSFQHSFPESIQFTGVMATVDLLSSTLSGREPTYAMQHQILFSTESNLLKPSSHMFHVGGIAGWALQAILQTFHLDTWRSEQITTKSLSIAELVKRAMQIEESIIDRRKELSRLLTTEYSAGAAVKDTWILSNIFAAATLVYLRTVVSGPNPDVLEIQAAVNDTVEAIQLVPDLTLLSRLSWPVCVAASMAQPENRSFWSKLSEGSRAQSKVLQDGHSLSRVVQVVEKCWEMRDTGHSVDWRDVMKSLDQQFIIL